MPDYHSRPRHAVYALTSNGDWMEMTPRPGDSPPEVTFIAVDVANTDELYDRAEEGEGEVLARVVVPDGRPEFERLPPSDSSASALPGEHFWVDFGTGRLTDEGCRFCGDTLEDIAAAGGHTRCLERGRQETIARALCRHLGLAVA